jgi:hypothetical protein
MSGVIVALVGGGGLVVGVIALGRWLGDDKQTMREARDAHNAQRFRRGDHDGHVGGDAW